MRSKILAFAVLAVIGFGQTPPKDVYGWGKVRWGMTLAQAKAALGPQAEDSTEESATKAKYPERLVIDRVDIGDVRMKASIGVDPSSNRIRQVLLNLWDGISRDPRGRDVRGDSYYTILTALKQKYGKPIGYEKDVQGDYIVTNRASWIFPSTASRTTVFAKLGSGKPREATSNLPTPKSLTCLDWAATTSGRRSTAATIDRRNLNLNLMKPILRFLSVGSDASFS